MLQKFNNYVCYFIFYETCSILSFLSIFSDFLSFCLSSTTYCAWKNMSIQELVLKQISYDRAKNVQSTFARRFCVAFLRHSSFAKACVSLRSFHLIGKNCPINQKRLCEMHSLFWLIIINT